MREYAKRREEEAAEAMELVRIVPIGTKYGIVPIDSRYRIVPIGHYSIIKRTHFHRQAQVVSHFSYEKISQKNPCICHLIYHNYE